MLLTGMALAIPCVLGIVFYAQWLDKKYPEFGAQAAQTRTSCKPPMSSTSRRRRARPCRA